MSAVETTTRADAISTLTGGDEALGALVERYAKAFEDDPAAFSGMLAATLNVLLGQVGEIHELLGKIKPFVDDPNALLDSIPAPLRAMLGV